MQEPEELRQRKRPARTLTGAPGELDELRLHHELHPRHHGTQARLQTWDGAVGVGIQGLHAAAMGHEAAQALGLPLSLVVPAYTGGATHGPSATVTSTACTGAAISDQRPGELAGLGGTAPVGGDAATEASATEPPDPAGSGVAAAGETRKHHRPCQNCRASRVLCDRWNPCGRCTRLGLETTCQVPPTVKFGRPRRDVRQARLEEIAANQLAVALPMPPSAAPPTSQQAATVPAMMPAAPGLLGAGMPPPPPIALAEPAVDDKVIIYALRKQLLDLGVTPCV